MLIIGQLAIKESQSGLAILEVARDGEGRVAEITEFEIPGHGTGHFESPLLDAFANGFHQGTRQRLN